MKYKSLHISSFIAIICFIFIAFGSEESDNSTSGTSKMLAYNYAEDFVKQRLKSPSTAKFPSIYEKSDHVTELGNDEYIIASWVDSQNGFGAMIRSNFRCKIIFEGNNVRVESLTIN